MSTPGLLQVALYVVVLLMMTKPLGVYLARVFGGERTLLDRILGPLERGIYRTCAIDPHAEQS
jgi:K+-transporting ATPase ATPase A chain